MQKQHLSWFKSSCSSWNNSRCATVVLLLCAVVLSWVPTAAAQPAVNASLRFQKPYNVCTSDWAPIVSCADIEDTKDFSGYQVALWRKVAEDLGLVENTDWSFTCMDWSAMIDDLVSPNGGCSFAAAGVEVSLPNIVSGLKFSWPIYKSGFQVLIASNVEEGGIWAFAQAFHWSVWVSLGATAIAVSVIITVAELLAGGERSNRKGLRGWSWYCMTKMVQVTPHVGDPKTWASRILVLGYAFLVLIMVHLFTATTASKMTMQRLANDISSKADLPGKKVMSWEPYVPLLRKYSIDATPQPWDNDVDTARMLSNLRTHKYQALILDSPVLQYFAAQAAECDLYVVGDAFETFNLAIAFPPDAPDSLPAAVSASIVRLQTTAAVLDELENKYIKSAGHGTTTDDHGEVSTGSGGCTNQLQMSGAGGGHSTSSSISLQQVLGLWYILAMTFGMALLLTAVHNISKPDKRQLLINLLLCRGWPPSSGSNRVQPAAGAGGRGAGEAQEEDRNVLEGGGGVCEVNVVRGLGHRGAQKKGGGEGTHKQQQGGLAREVPVLPGVAGP